MRRKELTIFNVRRSNDETPAALVLLIEHARLFAPLVTHTRPMERIERGIRDRQRLRRRSWKNGSETVTAYFFR